MKNLYLIFLTIFIFTLADNNFLFGKDTSEKQVKVREKNTIQEDANEIQNVEKNRKQWIHEQREKRLKQKNAIKNAESADNSKDPNKALGKAHQMHLRAIGAQLANEQAKYLERQAKLDRIIKLAEDKGNTKLQEKAEKLKLREKQRYEQMTQRLNDRKQKIEQLKQSDAPEKAKKELREIHRERMVEIDKPDFNSVSSDD